MNLTNGHMPNCQGKYQPPASYSFLPSATQPWLGLTFSFAPFMFQKVSMLTPFMKQDTSLSLVQIVFVLDTFLT